MSDKMPTGWGRGRKRKYHFDEIPVGEEKLFEGTKRNPVKINTLTTCCHRFRAKYGKVDWQFTMRTEGHNVRVRRLK